MGRPIEVSLTDEQFAEGLERLWWAAKSSCHTGAGGTKKDLYAMTVLALVQARFEREREENA